VKNNSIKGLTDYLKRNMEAADLKSIKRPLFTITLAAGKESVVIDSDDAVPDEYVAVKVASTPDKKAIADFLKDLREKNAEVQKRIDAGEDAEHELQAEPEWARLQRGESSLRIK
ncbi:MAG: siphovirus Gp157 family protein, partial [Pseudomonas sp.]|nr:siphovirus Gp157 family protein [Pseudomonas sp.]